MKIQYSMLVGALVGALTLSACSDSSTLTAPETAPVERMAPPNTAFGGQIPDRYIVVFRDDLKDVPALSSSMAREHGIAIDHVYKNALNGFSAVVPEMKIDALRRDPRIAYVEPDYIVRACSTSTFQTLDWGVDAIQADLSSTAAGDGTGAVTGNNVRVYIIDSGIQTNHPDLNVAGGINYAGGSSSAYGDGNGHGTHVAGIAAARDNGSYMVGVAPGAALYAVRVLDNNGSGSISGVIAGVDWVRAQKNASSSVPMVANMSLGGPTSNSLDQAVNNLINAGVTVVVAAGNSGANASSTSPARVSNAITVGAYDVNNNFASWSNYGSKLDINAPGVSIRSTYPGSNTAVMSGTSMASPHVAGAAALYLSLSGNASKSPSQVRNQLVADATSSVNVTRSSTTNKALYVGGY